MARLRHAGAEFYDTNTGAGAFGTVDIHTKTGAVTRDTATKRTGLASWKCDTGAGNAAAWFELDSISGVSANTTQWFRYYVRFTSFPTTTVAFMMFGTPAVSQGVSLKITPSGTVIFFDEISDVDIDSASSFNLSTGTWYRMEVSLTFNGSTQLTGASYRINGQDEGSGSVTPTSIIYAFSAGWMTGGLTGNANLVMHVDDFAVNDSTGSANNSWPGAGGVVRMLPTADSQRGSWTGGSGGTTNLFDALDNVPPAGTASESNTTQIESTDDSGDNATDEYRASMGSYTTAGVPADATIDGIIQLIAHGEDASAGTKTGSFGLQANPAETYQTFTYGDDAGALGTYPTNWGGLGIMIEPAVQPTLGSALIMAVRTTNSSSSRVRSVCALWAYVGYSEAVVVPYVPRNPAITFQDPGLLMRVLDAWERTKGGILVPRLWTSEGATI